MSDVEDLHKKFSNTKVLYVEDEEEVKDMSLKFFKNFFKDVDTASNGEEGLELFKNNNYALVISDLRMPKMDGREMLKQIDELDKDVVKVVITASDSNIDASTTICDAYMTKPIEFDEFIKTFKSLVLRK